MAKRSGTNSEGRSTVTKRDLADRVYERCDDAEIRIKRHEARELLQMYLDEMLEALVRGERIELRDFGVFEIKRRAPRRGQNPRTLKPVAVPARQSVKFKPGRLMRERVEIDLPDDEQASGAAAAAADPATAARKATEAETADRDLPTVEIAPGVRQRRSVERTRPAAASSSSSSPTSSQLPSDTPRGEDGEVPIRARRAATPSQ
ncbi:MAG: HU family DNA-binding protein [Planctomycetota bacterium]